MRRTSPNSEDGSPGNAGGCGSAARPIGEGASRHPPEHSEANVGGQSTARHYQPALTTAELDVVLGQLVENHRQCEWLLCRYLADVAEDRRYREIGWYSDVYHYAHERFGLTAKSTRERVRIGRALRQLPRIEEAFVSGALGYSRVRELTRVATAATETAWLEMAGRLTIRELERRVAHEVGDGEVCDGPAEVHWRTPETVELRMRLPASAWALLSRAMTGVRQVADGPRLLNDAEAIEAVAREALAALAATSKSDATAIADPRRTVVIYQCRECGQSELETNAGAVALARAEAARLACGAARIDLATEGVTPKADDERPGEGGRMAWQGQATDQDLEPGSKLEGDPGQHGQAGSRGADIPPAVKRAVLARDRARCRLCGRRRYVEIHHLVARSEGGKHTRPNLCTLCSTCHDAVHEGRVRLVGDAERGLAWLDAEGLPLGSDERASGGLVRDDDGHGLSPEAAAVLRGMGGRGAFTLDELVSASGITVSEMARGVTELEVAGRVRRDSCGRVFPADRPLRQRGATTERIAIWPPSVPHVGHHAAAGPPAAQLG